MDELRELGAEPDEPGVRGAWFKAQAATLYRVAYATRLASRVLAPLLTFDCHSDEYLYKTARKIEWDRLLDPDRTFVIDASVSESHIDHSQFAAQRLKDAVCDHFREKTGRRPSVEKRTPDLRLYLHLRRNRAVIGIDVGGGALHRRGYRTESVEAPLQETLAAAMVRLSGWDAERPLHDPMCGSGTLLAEAVLHATRTPSGWLRAQATPPWATLPDFDAAVWNTVKAELDGAVRELPDNLVSGADLDAAAVRAARTNLANVPGGTSVRIGQRDARELALQEPSTVLVNPPYGVRLGDRLEVEALYKALGDALKQRCTGTTAFVLCGDVKLVGSLGLKPSKRTPLWNGGIECRLARLDLY
ncbi:MAG: THUMP domain-containing protein [Longimicrobiales bacterium]|nr:THUMP domain-containing protein [Longimicrobiales bacterium]